MRCIEKHPHPTWTLGKPSLFPCLLTCKQTRPQWFKRAGQFLQESKCLQELWGPG